MGEDQKSGAGASAGSVTMVAGTEVDHLLLKELRELRQEVEQLRTLASMLVAGAVQGLALSQVLLVIVGRQSLLQGRSLTEEEIEVLIRDSTKDSLNLLVETGADLDAGAQKVLEKFRQRQEAILREFKKTLDQS